MACRYLVGVLEPGADVFTVAMRLITCLDRLLGKGSSESSHSSWPSPTKQRFADGQNDLLILSSLDLIQGTLLLHPPSRSLFAREIYMNVRFRSPTSGYPPPDVED